MIPQFVGKSMPLSESGLTNVCSQLGTDAAAIWAVLTSRPPDVGFWRIVGLRFSLKVTSSAAKRTASSTHRETSAIRRRVATAPGRR